MHVDRFYRAVDLRQDRMLCKNLKLIEAIDSECWNTSETVSLKDMDSKHVTFGWKEDVLEL
jgi:hypothetical protein